MWATILSQLYLLGYKQWMAPRAVRRLMAGTIVHRAWLAGNMGLYESEGEKYGVCDRQWYTNRSK